MYNIEGSELADVGERILVSGRYQEILFEGGGLVK